MKKKIVFEEKNPAKTSTTSTDSENWKMFEKQGLLYIILKEEKKTHLWKKISISITAISLYKKKEWNKLG